MADSQRALKQRIRSTETLQEIFRAMEVIAASRVGKARGAAESITTYDFVVAAAAVAASAHSSLNHPLITEHIDTKKVVVLAVTSDQDMAGAYSVAILRETERLIGRLYNEGKEPVIYISGRRALSCFDFRGAEITASWTGNSDRPSEARTQEVARRLLGDFLAPADQGGISELYMIYTKFCPMVPQAPQVRGMLPIEVIDPSEEIQIGGMGLVNMYKDSVLPFYEFEPNAREVLETVMPLYMESRIRAALLHAAATELAGRQGVIYPTTDNAQDLISGLAREMNQARQAEITTEISEIVSGADALKETKK